MIGVVVAVAVVVVGTGGDFFNLTGKNLGDEHPCIF